MPPAPVISLETFSIMSLQVNYEQWGYGPPHPGELLREQILPRLTLSRKELAAKLGVSLTRLSDFLAERRPVSLDMARRLGKAFGNGARYWLALQMQHDVWTAEREDTIEVAPILFPVGALANRKSAAEARISA
jgi:antitoxin HigA-1